MEGGIRERCSLSIFTPTPGLAFEPTEWKAGARLAASWWVQLDSSWSRASEKALKPQHGWVWVLPGGYGMLWKSGRGAAVAETCTACNRDQLLTLDCKSHSIASRVWTDSSSPAWVMVTSLGSIAWTTGYDLLMTISSVLNLYQMTARTDDGGTHPWKTSLYWVPGLCFENAKWGRSTPGWL